MLSRSCGGILFDAQGVDMPDVWCEQRLPHCRKLKDAIKANVKIAERDPELLYWFFGKPFTRVYLMRGDTHQTLALKFELCHRTATSSPISLG